MASHNDEGVEEAMKENTCHQQSTLEGLRESPVLSTNSKKLRQVSHLLSASEQYASVSQYNSWKLQPNRRQHRVSRKDTSMSRAHVSYVI